MLAPRLDAEQIVVMDNLGAHRLKRKVRKLIEVRGAERIYPLAYFLDYNLTEEALVKIKNLLRKAVARS